MTVIGGVGHTLPFLIGEFTVSPDCRCFGGRHRTRCHLLGAATATWTLQRSAALQTGLGSVPVCLLGMFIGNAKAGDT
jgi:hypothetical protein